MVKKITKASSRIASAFVVCFLSTGCGLVSNDSGIFQPSDQRLLSKLERKHNKLRAKTKQELANSLETLIEAHPDLVFGYQRMVRSNEPAVANRARYRLAQVYLELGCSIHFVETESRESWWEGSWTYAGLAEMSEDELGHAWDTFQKVDVTVLPTLEQQRPFWSYAFRQDVPATMPPHTLAPEIGEPELQTCMNIDDLRWRRSNPKTMDGKRYVYGIVVANQQVCDSLKSQYLGHLESLQH